MSQQSETKTDLVQPPRPTRAQRLAVAGFFGAFGLTIITVLLTSYYVRLATSRRGHEPPPAATAPQPATDASASSVPRRDRDARAHEAVPRPVHSSNDENGGENAPRAPDPDKKPAHGTDPAEGPASAPDTGAPSNAAH